MQIVICHDSIASALGMKKQKIVVDGTRLRNVRIEGANILRPTGFVPTFKSCNLVSRPIGNRKRIARYQSALFCRDYFGGEDTLGRSEPNRGFCWGI